MHHHHINWWIVCAISYGAFQVFVSYLPAPGKPLPAPSFARSWWYEPLFHVLQYLSINPGRSMGLLKAAENVGQQQGTPTQPGTPAQP